MVADLHWMPLPSRVLVPGLWLWPAHGDQLVTVALAGLWAPLAVLLARQLGLPRSAWGLAGLLGLLGGGYVRFLSTPDSIALTGVVGSLAWLAAAGGRTGAAAAAAAALALTRGDGFLAAPCLGLVLAAQGRRGGGLVVAAAGPLAWALWQLRGVALAGPAVLEMRAAMGAALHIDELLQGRIAGGGLAARGAVVLRELGEAGQTVMLVGLFLLPLFALVGGWRARRQPLVWGLGAYALLMPVATLSLAPAIAASGTPFRSGAALYPAAAALAALGAQVLGGLGARLRGYPRSLPALLLGGAHALGTVGFGLAIARARPAPLVDCDVLERVPGDAVVFTGRPLELRGACGPVAVLLRRDDTAEAARALVVRHDVAWALLPAADPDPTVPTADDGERLLPGWAPVAPGLWRRPD